MPPDGWATVTVTDAVPEHSAPGIDATTVYVVVVVGVAVGSAIVVLLRPVAGVQW